MSVLDEFFPVYKIECTACSTTFHVLEKPGTNTCYFSRCPNTLCEARDGLKWTKISSLEELE